MYLTGPALTQVSPADLDEARRRSLSAADRAARGIRGADGAVVRVLPGSGDAAAVLEVHAADGSVVVSMPLAGASALVVGLALAHRADADLGRLLGLAPLDSERTSAR